MRIVGDISGKNEAGRSVCARLRKLFVLVGICLCFSHAVLAQTPDSTADDSNKSWATTSETKADYGNPTRTFESHTQSGNRTVDVRSVQTRGSDGSFTPYQDIETETVRVNATTTETTTRTFVRDGNGAKTVSQVTEEAKQTLPGGDSKVVRSTSNPDANGDLQLVQREVQETRKTSPDVEETKTTLMLTDINGGLAPAMQTQERQKHSGDTVEIQKITLLPGGSGGWQVGETRQATIQGDAQNRSKDERVSRPNADGKLAEVSHTVSKESVDASGEKRNSEETYSIDVPGVGRDHNVHLVQRVTTTEHSNSGGQQTTSRVEKANPGDPDAGLRVTTVNTNTVRLGPTGVQATQTIQARDGSGSLGVVSLDMSKSDNAQVIEVQIAPSKPK